MISHHQIAAAYQAVIPAVGNPAEAALPHKHNKEKVSFNNQLQFTQLFPQCQLYLTSPTTICETETVA